MHSKGTPNDHYSIDQCLTLSMKTHNILPFHWRCLNACFGHLIGLKLAFWFIKIDGNKREASRNEKKMPTILYIYMPSDAINISNYGKEKKGKEKELKEEEDDDDDDDNDEWSSCIK